MPQRRVTFQRQLQLLGFLCFLLPLIAFANDLRAFDDTVLFKINWPGPLSPDLPLQDLQPVQKAETYSITSANNEKYECYIPDTNEKEKDFGETYNGPNPIEILSLLFTESGCSYRLESYWTYELCHGKYVRQYHEEREGKKVKVQEYYLGTFDKTQKAKLSKEYDERMKNPNYKNEIPMKKVDGINMPYVEIEMKDGTICDLTGKPRTIKVLYVCYQHGKNEIFSSKEISSCEYEAVVLSSLLCTHPDYKPQDTGENTISCVPSANSPKKPRSLYALELESLRLRHQKVTDDKLQKVYAVFHVDKDEQDGEPRVTVEIRPVEEVDRNLNGVEEGGTSPASDRSNLSPVDTSPVQNFLSGKHCLNGGNGWWKYEFCYGRLVDQYHVERDGTKTIVNLGKFNKEKHIEWIEAHPAKKPKAQRKQLSHFYSDGTLCDKTGKPRQTEVKLKCVENHMASPSSVSLFLLEPKTCEYILGVESQLICDILEYADENGLISDKISLNFNELKTNFQTTKRSDIDERIANDDDE